MSRDDGMVAVMREAFVASLDDLSEDPAALERVGRGIGAALGDEATAVTQEAGRPDPPDAALERRGPHDLGGPV